MTSVSRLSNINSSDVSKEIVTQIISGVPKTASIQKLNKVEQIILETQWTNILQNLVDYGNKHLLKSFQYKLTMDEV